MGLIQWDWSSGIDPVGLIQSHDRVCLIIPRVGLPITKGFETRCLSLVSLYMCYVQVMWIGFGIKFLEYDSNAPRPILSAKDASTINIIKHLVGNQSQFTINIIIALLWSHALDSNYNPVRDLNLTRDSPVSHQSCWNSLSSPFLSVIFVKLGIIPWHWCLLRRQAGLHFTFAVGRR